MMMRRKRRAAPRHVFRQYMISYLGIALFICMLSGLAILYALSGQMRALAQGEYALRASAAAKELKAYVESMSDISLKVKTTECYLPIFIKRGTLSEVELIKDLSKYQDYLPFHYQYYVYYRDLGTVYSPSSRYDYDVFRRYVMPEGEPGALDALLDEADPERGYAVFPSPSGGRSLVFAFPQTVRGSRTYVLFLIDKTVLAERLSLVAGMGADEVLLYEGDQLLLGRPSANRDEVVAQLPDGGLMLSVSASNGYARLQDGIRNAALILAAIAILSTLAALYMAWRSYRPIRNMVDKFVPDDTAASDELQWIERMLTDAMRDSHGLEKRLQGMVMLLNEQRNSLRQRLMDLMLKGNCDEGILSDLEAIGVTLRGPYFAVAQMTFRGAYDFEELYALITSLSGHDTAFQPLELNERGRIAILVNMTERNDLNYVMSVLDALRSDIRQPFELKVQGVCEGADGLPGLMAALNRPPREDGAPVPAFDRGLLDELAAEIAAGNEEDALSLLGEIGNNIDFSHPDKMERREAYRSALSAIEALQARISPASPEIGGEGTTIRVRDARPDSRAADDARLSAFAGNPMPNRDGEGARAVAPAAGSHAEDGTRLSAFAGGAMPSRNGDGARAAASAAGSHAEDGVRLSAFAGGPMPSRNGDGARVAAPAAGSHADDGARLSAFAGSPMPNRDGEGARVAAPAAGSHADDGAPCAALADAGSRSARLDPDAPDVADAQAFFDRAQTLVRRMVGEASDDHAEAGKLTGELLHYIDAHLVDYEMTLTHLSEVFGTSTRHISRVIKLDTGLSYKEWLVSRRVEYAKRLLAAGEMSVNEVGAAIGYTNISYFIKVFKEAVGVTPAAYRISAAPEPCTAERVRGVEPREKASAAG